MSEAVLHRLKGLKQLDIHVYVRVSGHPLPRLLSFAQRDSLKKLAALNLASVRFTVDTEDDKATNSVLEWIRCQEEKIVPKQRRSLAAD